MPKAKAISQEITLRESSQEDHFWLEVSGLSPIVETLLKGGGYGWRKVDLPESAHSSFRVELHREQLRDLLKAASTLLK